ncbi:uncharacterized protein LOC130902975 [Diorhabda carinulata]|uniref:uncharacterized protein LOC130902975 n=1 Tax=Diorhabda carinulata TaxID=1163345 RepID=UPI0025A2A165|nr:uncharacterized protein LOC130902975 [Diorhabda carinulata]
MGIKGFGVPEMKNKIRALRSTQSQEKKKIRDLMKSGAGSEDIYIPNAHACWTAGVNACARNGGRQQKVVWLSHRRKIRPKKFSTDDEQEEVLSSSEDDFPKNKKPLPRPKPIIRKSITNILSDYSGPIQTFPLASAGQSQRSFEDSDSTNQLYYLPPQHSAKDTQLTKSSGQIIRGSASNQSFCQAAVSNSSPYNPSTSKATDVQSNIRAVVESNGANTQDDVITLLKTIREQNNQILQWIRKQDRSGNHASNTDLPDDIGVQFPLNSQEDITKLETYLSEKNNCLALVGVLYHLICILQFKLCDSSRHIYRLLEGEILLDIQTAF